MVITNRQGGNVTAKNTELSESLEDYLEVIWDLEKANVNGGAIALGHALGNSGARLTTTLMHAMKRQNARYGIVSMCIGFGMGAAGVFEREPNY